MSVQVLIGPFDFFKSKTVSTQQTNGVGSTVYALTAIFKCTSSLYWLERHRCQALVPVSY